jgi:HupE / UreJ protein
MADILNLADGALQHGGAIASNRDEVGRSIEDALFAGALNEVGLPHDRIPTALLFFNIGVEIGQLLFVVGITGLIAI